MHVTTDGKIGGEYSTDRYYKVGDVIRSIPVTRGTGAYARCRQGLGIIVEVNGPRFEAYWTGDGKLRKADCRPMGFNIVLWKVLMDLAKKIEGEQ